MIVVVIIVFLLLWMLVRIKLNNSIIRNMMYVFLLFWGTSIILSLSNPFDLYPVSNRIYFLLLLFVLSFSFGIFSSKSLYQQPNEQNSRTEISKYIDAMINNRIFIMLILFFDVFLLYLYVKEQAILATATVLEVRHNLDELLYEGNSFLGLTRNMIITPITPIVSFLGAYMLFFNRKRVVTLFLVLFFVIVSALIGGSRGGVLRVLMYCFFIIICRNLFKKQEHKSKSPVSIILFFSVLTVLVLLIMSNMTAQREYNISGFSWEGVVLGAESLSRHFVTYCVGPFRALDYAFTNDYVGQIGGYKWGGCTFGFVDGMLSLILNAIGVSYTPAYRPLTTLVQENWIYVGANEYFNFAYTAIMFFYSDLGYLGVVVFPFIFGRVINALVNKFIANQNPMALIVISYLFTIMLDSVFTWRLYRYQAFITFLIMIILYHLYGKKHKCIYSP